MTSDSYLHGIVYTRKLIELARIFRQHSRSSLRWVYIGGAARHLLQVSCILNGRRKKFGQDDREHKDIDAVLFQRTAFDAPYMMGHHHRTHFLGYATELLHDGFYFDHEITPTPDDVVELVVRDQESRTQRTLRTISPEFLLVTELCFCGVRPRDRLSDVGQCIEVTGLDKARIEQCWSRLPLPPVGIEEIITCSNANDVLKLAESVERRILDAHPWRQHLDGLPLECVPVFAGLRHLSSVCPHPLLQSPRGAFMSQYEKALQCLARASGEDIVHVIQRLSLGLSLICAPLNEYMHYYAEQEKHGKNMLNELARYMLVSMCNQHGAMHQLNAARELHQTLALYDDVFGSVRRQRFPKDQSLWELHARVAGAIIEAQCLYWQCGTSYRWDFSVPARRLLSRIGAEYIPTCTTPQLLGTGYTMFGQWIKSFHEERTLRNRGGQS